MKCRADFYPEIIPGSSIGTVFENNPDVAEIKRNPTAANCHVYSS